MTDELDRQRRVNAQFKRLAELLCNNTKTKDRTIQWLNGELKDNEMRNLNVRLPEPLIERIERLLKDEQFVLRYGSVKRADVIRECLVRGIQIIEQESRKTR